jgi:hypothetical protein
VITLDYGTSDISADSVNLALGRDLESFRENAKWELKKLQDRIAGR